MPPGSCRSASCRAAARASSRVRSGCRATRSGAAVRVGEALEAGRTTSIGLGRVNGRRFCFSAGIGLDAEAVRRIDRRGRDRDGRRAGNAIFAATVSGVLIESRLRMRAAARDRRLRSRRVRLRRERSSVHLRRRRCRCTITGEAEFAAGLDFVAPREVSPASSPASLSAASAARSRRLERPHRARPRRAPRPLRRPLPLQADGEDLGDVTEAYFEAERDALDVLL